MNDRASVPTPSPGDGEDARVWTYIEDMLGELAGMASANGAYALATTITMAALEAARTGPRRGDDS